MAFSVICSFWKEAGSYVENEKEKEKDRRLRNFADPFISN